MTEEDIIDWFIKNIISLADGEDDMEAYTKEYMECFTQNVLYKIRRKKKEYFQKEE